MNSHHTERDRAITIAVLRSPLSLKEIGRQYGLSQQRVREIAWHVRATRCEQRAMAREARRPILDRRVHRLPLSAPLRSCLVHNARIDTVFDLLLWRWSDLLKIYNFGSRKRQELSAWFRENNLCLRAEPEPPSRQYETVPCPRCHGAGHVQREIKL